MKKILIALMLVFLLPLTTYSAELLDTTITGTLDVTDTTTLGNDVNVNANMFLSENYSIQFRDAQLYINSDADGYLDLHADTATRIASDVFPATDDTYYVGKNDDDTPFAWKGIILKDTTDGKYYRIEVINGVITATDLTD